MPRRGWTTGVHPRLESWRGCAPTSTPSSSSAILYRRSSSKASSFNIYIFRVSRRRLLLHNLLPLNPAKVSAECREDIKENSKDNLSILYERQRLRYQLLINHGRRFIRWNIETTSDQGVTYTLPSIKPDYQIRMTYTFKSSKISI